MTALAVLGLLLAPWVTPSLASDTDALYVLAEAAPLPRLDPRARAGDPIAALISGAAEPAGTAEPEAAVQPTDLASVGFTLAVELLRKGDPAGATIAAYALSDSVSADLIDWLIATSGDKSVPSSRIMEIMAKLKTWPGRSLMQLRLEQALLREEADGPTLVAALDNRDLELHDAMLAMARGLKSAGRVSEATAIIRDLWRKETPEEDIEKSILTSFGSILTAKDHKARLDRLLYDGHADAALRTAKHLDGTQRKLAAAVAATIKRQSKAKGLLERLPSAAAADPLAIFAKVQTARRAGRDGEAARLLATAPTTQSELVDPDAWWVERRIVSRALAEKGDYRAAYDVAAAHHAKSSTRRAEAEFHAGWFALEYLDDPATAKTHFARITKIASRPLSLSRAYYWLGRAAQASGDATAAEEQFTRASGYKTAFYGQLALAEIAAPSLLLTRAQRPSARDRERFEDRRYVRVIQRLLQANHADRTGLFFRKLARELDDPGEVKLLSDLAQSAGLHQTALQVGIIASSRGLNVDDLAFRTEAIPPGTKTGDVEKEVVYAIARQESKFNQQAISRAGARGLLQLMPATAKETAKALGLRYSRDRLTADPAFNATLGASFLGQMMDRFGGSYVMTFAAYNAGGSRVDDWIKRFGDPRDPDVDIVNWIEAIPFTETRNYVQRVMENLQVYRARFGDNTLSIMTDLRRRDSS
ncbi:MAG: transglycosylase SLT domain-containing protein [Alphaproteobacteria bacterium]